MWRIYILLAALDLAGVYFNVRMLLSCLTIEPKRAFLRKCRPLVICQFVYQVSVLAMNSIEAWSGLNVQHEESCSVFKLVSICINIFLVSNLSTMMIVIAVDHPRAYKNQEVSPKPLLLAPVCLGFVGSAVLWWCICSSFPEFESHVIAIMFFAVFPPFLLVTLKKYMQCDQTNEKVNVALLWDTFKETKKACLLTAWLLIFFGVVIGLGTSPWSSNKEFDENIICLFMINCIVGIRLPVVIESVYAAYEEEKEETAVVI